MAVTDTLKRRHSLTVTLDKTKITSSDAILIVLKRTGSTDAYSGTLMVAAQGGLEFGT